MSNGLAFSASPLTFPGEGLIARTGDFSPFSAKSFERVTRNQQSRVQDAARLQPLTQ